MIFAIFVGGGIGAVLRYLISLVFIGTKFFLPYHTLIANFIGCFIAGVALSYLSSKTTVNPVYKNFIITGLCGGLTTFSTFSIESVNFIQSGEYFKAVFYIFISLLICIISVLLGFLIFKKLS